MVVDVWTGENMNDQQADTYQVIATIIAVVTVILSIIIWFIFITEAGVREEQMKHETCMTVTKKWNDSQKGPIVEVTSYCGPKGEHP